jgi:hypothetical protein
VAALFFIYWAVNHFLSDSSQISNEPQIDLPRVNTNAIESEPAPASPGVFAINYDQRRGSQRSALMIGAAPEFLLEIFFDLVERLGEKIVLILDEKPFQDKPLQMLSFTRPIDPQQLQMNLAEFADVINCLRAVEVTAQNTEKCCCFTLKMDKSIVLETCNATPFIAVLERRGLRRIQPDDWQHCASNQKEVSEERLAQLKQKLEISSCYVPNYAWLN